MNLSFNDAIRSEIVNKGGVSALLELLRTGNDQQKEIAAGALRNVVNSDEGRDEKEASHR